jgi:hypothetical protein
MNEGYMFRLNLLAIIGPNYNSIKGDIFYKCISGFRSQLSQAN